MINVTRYNHEMNRLGAEENEIHNSVRIGLDVIRAMSYNQGDSMMPLITLGTQSSTRKARSTSTGGAGRKRSSSRTNTPPPPSKRTSLGSLTKGGTSSTIQNWAHRRVIVGATEKLLHGKLSRRHAGCAARLHRR